MITTRNGPKSLTVHQATVLAYIDGFIYKNQRPPTLREISKHFGTRSHNSVVATLGWIKKKGFLCSGGHGEQRTLRIIKNNDADRILLRGEWFVFIPAEGI